MLFSTMVMAFLGALVAYLVGHFAMPIGMRLGVMDHPDYEGGRKLHATSTPLVGGLAIVLATAIGTLFMLWTATPDIQVHVLGWFLFTVTAMFLIGTMDDRTDLSASTRLAFASAVLLAAISQVPDFAVSFLLFSGQTQLVLMTGLFGILFTLICFVGFLNAVNMADGKNGLVIGQALIWSAILFVRLPSSVAPLVAAIVGALAVLLWFNMRGKLFLGDGGSYGLSALFGLLAIYAWNHGFADMRADDIALIFALPVFDTLRLIAHRIVRGKSPFAPGRDHLHHYLYTRWGWPTPLPFILALVAIPNIAAVLIPGTAVIWLGVTLLGYLGLLWVATNQERTHNA